MKIAKGNKGIKYILRALIERWVCKVIIMIRKMGKLTGFQHSSLWLLLFLFVLREDVIV